MDKAMANAQVYVVQFFGAPLPDEPRRRSFCSRRWPLSMISFPLRRSAARWAISTTSASLMAYLTAAGSAWCGVSRFTPNVAKSTEQWRGRAVRSSS